MFPKLNFLLLITKTVLIKTSVMLQRDKYERDVTA